MSTQINIQRISKQSGRLDASGLAVLGSADNKNNLLHPLNPNKQQHHKKLKITIIIIKEMKIILVVDYLKEVF